MKHLLSNRNPLQALSFVLLALVVVLSGCAVSAQPLPAQQAEIMMVPHVVAGMAEQDVYVEAEGADGNVMRIAPDQAEALGDAPLFSAATTITHDPFAVSDAPIGPFAKGEALGITLAEWTAATGTGTYTVRGSEAEIDLRFENLVSDGTYTVWCSYLSMPPHVYITDMPCGAIDGSQNAFTADANGRAEFNLTMPKLAEVMPGTMAVIAIAYHSNGETYGMYPGDFGANSHVQIFGAIPAPGEAWQTVE